MSSPGCIAVIEHGKFRACYSRGVADSMHRILFWGPADALQRINEWAEWDECHDALGNPELNYAYDEAACCIDFDKRVVVLYFSTDVSYEQPLLEAYLRLLRYTWPGWEIRWAWREFWDIASWAGCSQEALDNIEGWQQQLYPNTYDMDYVMAHLFEHPDHADTSLSFTKDATTRICMIDLSEPEHLLSRRENLESSLGKVTGDGVTLECVPFSGLHLDYDDMEIHRWGTWGNAFSIVEQGWDGWAIIDHKADYRAFLRVLGDAIRVIERPESDYVSWLRDLYVTSNMYDDWPWSEAERASRFDEIERQYARDNPVPVMVPTEELLGIVWA